MHWSDGNLAALAQYERELDAADVADQMLEEAQAELADDLYDAYLYDINDFVIAEVDDAITDSETALGRMRKAMLYERGVQLKDRGAIVHKVYMDVITEACESIADRTDSLESVDELRAGLKL